MLKLGETIGPKKTVPLKFPNSKFRFSYSNSSLKRLFGNSGHGSKGFMAGAALYRFLFLVSKMGADRFKHRKQVVEDPE